MISIRLSFDKDKYNPVNSILEQASLYFSKVQKIFEKYTDDPLTVFDKIDDRIFTTADNCELVLSSKTSSASFRLTLLPKESKQGWRLYFLRCDNQFLDFFSDDIDATTSVITTGNVIENQQSLNYLKYISSISLEDIDKELLNDRINNFCDMIDQHLSTVKGAYFTVEQKKSLLDYLSTELETVKKEYDDYFYFPYYSGNGIYWTISIKQDTNIYKTIKQLSISIYYSEDGKEYLDIQTNNQAISKSAQEFNIDQFKTKFQEVLSIFIFETINEN